MRNHWSIIFLPLAGLCGSFAVMALFTLIGWRTLPPDWQAAGIRIFTEPAILPTLTPLSERYIRLMMVAGWLPLSKSLVVFSLSYQAALNRLHTPTDSFVEIDAAFVREIATPPDAITEEPQSSITDIIEQYAEERPPS